MQLNFSTHKENCDILKNKCLFSLHIGKKHVILQRICLSWQRLGIPSRPPADHSGSGGENPEKGQTDNVFFEGIDKEALCFVL